MASEEDQVAGANRVNVVGHRRRRITELDAHGGELGFGRLLRG